MCVCIYIYIYISYISVHIWRSVVLKNPKEILLNPCRANLKNGGVGKYDNKKSNSILT